jgi:3-hydroxybutyryl-CoA dehydrogenase
MNVAIIGSGTMGSGIAQVAATSGCAVKLFDLNQEALTKC